MKVFAPKYYKNFVCIADRCRHSCCIGWEIDVDEESVEKYRSLGRDGVYNVTDSIEDGEVPHFKLTEGDRCPHLDERGLCRIITCLGEGYLCNICREHPRFYNETSDGLEAGLGLSCEEACRLVLSSDDYGEMVVVEETEGESSVLYDSRPLRKRLFDLLSRRDVPYVQRLSRIYGELSLSPSVLSDGEWREVLSGLEYLDPLHKELFLSYSSGLSDSENESEGLERALAYFIYRHVTAAQDPEEAMEALGFCLFCERLLSSVVSAHPGLEMLDAARIISEELEYSEDNTDRIKLEFRI